MEDTDLKKRDGDKKCELTHTYTLYNTERRACTLGGKRLLGLQGSTMSSHTEIHSRPEAPQQHIRLFLIACKHACDIAKFKTSASKIAMNAFNDI